MQPKWLLTKNDDELASRLSSELNVHPITAQILINRGIKSADVGKIFLNPKLSYLPDPFLIPGMEKAVERILDALRSGEKIAIFGDYDTDGVTSTALLIRFFRECGISANSYIPNRISEGYGLNTNGINKLKSAGTSLIITADNGSNSHEEINHAKQSGIDTIVTDHHEIAENMPAAFAIVNPKTMSQNSEFRNLAGVGVAFYLICALRAKLRDEKYFADKEPNLKSYLDLVAIGTIADVVPLTELNRILVKQGIEVLKQTKNPGIRSLAEAASTPLEELNAGSIAFRLSPRINAAGRLGDHSPALELLITEDTIKAKEIAAILNKMNSERQSVEKNILRHLEDMIDETLKKKSSIVLWSDDWHPGVIGIAASRLTESYRKPCALISIKGNSGRGSVRSVGNFNIMDTLTSCSDTLTNYGGHRLAAGFDINVDNLERFSDEFEKHTSRHLSEEDRTPTINLDAEIDLSEINKKLIDELEKLEPFGAENPKPILSTRDCKAMNTRIVGTNHLKLKIGDDTTKIDAIGFGLGGCELHTNKKYKFAGSPELNHWNGVTSIQFKLKDIKSEEET